MRNLGHAPSLLPACTDSRLSSEPKCETVMAEPLARARCGEGQWNHSLGESILKDGPEGARYGSKHSNILTCLISEILNSANCPRRKGLLSLILRMTKQVACPRPRSQGKYRNGLEIRQLAGRPRSTPPLPRVRGRGICGEGCPGGVGAGPDRHTCTPCGDTQRR